MSQIFISIKCFLSSSAGFRAIATTFRILNKWVSLIATPAYTTVRQWLLKIGLYQLTRSKYSRQGWFFIIDTSIQMGPQKCVVVLGIKIQDLNKNFCPTLEDAEPLVVKPVYSCPGEVIDGVLEEATQLVGQAPKAVISDEGSELKRGMRLYNARHSETIHLFDISHKINACLKEELESELVWQAFKAEATESIQRLKLSHSAHLAPPKQRSKDRMHSSFHLIEWGLRALQFLNSELANTLTAEERGKIEWVENYRFSLPSYILFKDICERGLNLVHEKGYYLGIADEFLRRTSELKDLRHILFRNKIRNILHTEEQKISDATYYLGSSEIIESLFGKFKAIEGVHASSGLTSLVLAMPALVGRLSETQVMEAMTTVSVRDVERWVNTNMSQTFLSKRRLALRASYNKNQTEEDLGLCDL